jgi:tetratricopeptide (TPR) repeat protein
LAVPARDSHRKLAKANHLRVQGDLEAAYALCEEILAEYPHELDAYLLMAQIAADKGDEQEALHWSRMAADLAPEIGKVEILKQSLQERLEAEEVAQPIQDPRRKNKAIVFAFLCVFFMMAAVWFALSFGNNLELRTSRSKVQLKPVVIEMRAEPPPVSREPLPMVSQFSVSPSAADLQLHNAILDRVGTSRQIFLSSADQQSGLLLSVMALEQDDPLKCAAYFALALKEINPARPMVIQVFKRKQLVLVATTRAPLGEKAIAQKKYGDPEELEDSALQGLFSEVKEFDLAPEEPALNSVSQELLEPPSSQR